MYKMIGGDGREYGPVSAEQLRQWFQEGRVNAQTRIQSEDHPQWRLLGEVPEFGDLFAAPGVAATAGAVPPLPPRAVPPVGASPMPDVAALTAACLAGDYQVQTGAWIGRAWEMIKQDFWLLVGASVVAGLLAGMGIIGLIIGGPMLGGLYGLFLKKRRGQPTSFGDAFAGFSVAFVPLMLAFVVSGLLTAVGLLLCLLPGIYLGVSWVFTLPLVYDKGLNFWDAMELSRKVVGKHWWGMFGFLLVGWLLAVGGLLVFCVGVFVTSAIFQVAIACAYEDIFGETAPTAP